MKNCSKCGNVCMDEAVICPKCGCAFENNSPNYQYYYNMPIRRNNYTSAIKVFMILGVVASLFMGLALLWCIPMTVHYFNSVKRNEPVGIAFKICTLLFVNIIAGILMLCDRDYL